MTQDAEKEKCKHVMHARVNDEQITDHHRYNTNDRDGKRGSMPPPLCFARSHKVVGRVSAAAMKERLRGAWVPQLSTVRNASAANLLKAPHFLSRRSKRRGCLHARTPSENDLRKGRKRRHLKNRKTTTTIQQHHRHHHHDHHQQQHQQPPKP